MQIDGFTLIAEIINFLILVVLLKHFLYDRIINLADAREAKVTARFKEAEQKVSQAQREAEKHRIQRQELENKREELIAQAQKEADARRIEWLNQTRAEVEESRAHWSQAIRQEQAAFMQELRQHTARQVYALARRTLADLADADLEQQMINVFVKQIEHLGHEERMLMTKSIQNSGRNVVIASAFEISPETRQKLLEVLRAQFDDCLNGQFSTSTALTCGIELKTDGHKVAWSLEHYLATLEENLANVLEQELSQKHYQKEVEADAQ